MLKVHCIYYWRLNELHEIVYLYTIAAFKRNRVRIVKLKKEILRRVRGNLGKSDKIKEVFLWSAEIYISNMFVIIDSTLETSLHC